MSNEGEVLWKCVYQCKGIQDCTNSCVNNFEKELQKCPCEVHKELDSVDITVF